jgi:integrase
MTPLEAKALIDAWLHAKLEEDAEIRDMPNGPQHKVAVFQSTEPWLPDRLVRTLDHEGLIEHLEHDPELRTLYGDGEFAKRDLTDRDIAKLGFEKPIHDSASRQMLDEDEVAAPIVRGLLVEAGIEIVEDSTGFKAAVRYMMQAQRDLLLAFRSRDETGWRRWSDEDPAQPLISRMASQSPLAATPEGVSAPIVTQSASMTLTDACERYIAESLRNASFKPGRADEVRNTVKVFVDWLGHCPRVADVSAPLAGEYRMDMSSYPTHGASRAAYRDLSVPERIAKSKADHDPNVISPATLNGKYMDPLRGLFDWTITAGQITTNPFQNIRVKAGPKGRSKAERPDFTVDQLQLLFSSTVFTGSAADSGKRLYKPGSHRVDDWRYWLPLIALFSGARLGELCGLRLADFGFRDESHFFHIQAVDEDQSLKTEAANRIVPVHPELIELGLIERVERLRTDGEVRLFPTITPGARGYLSDKPSKFFGDLIDRMLGKDALVVFHSLRHTFISGLRQARVARELRTALVGHDEADSVRREVHDGYGNEAFDRLVDGMKSVSWPALDLSGVRL